MPSLFEAPVRTVGFAQVAVERGIDRYPEGLTYAVPESLGDLEPGSRVIVPLGRGDAPTPGYVIEITAGEAPPDDIKGLKAILGRDDSAATLPRQLVDIARWISSYTCSPIGMTLASMLPAAVKRNVGAVVRTVIDLAEPRPDAGRLSAKQAAVVQALEALPQGDRPLEISRLAALAGLKTKGPIKKLLELGVLRRATRTSLEAVWARHATAAGRTVRLNDSQQRIADEIAAVLELGFSTHLLYGVTGSGKTEVYFALVERVVERGKTALVLVPEIALTPQTAGRLIGRFPARRVAILHSGLTAAQRHQQWAIVRRGEADIVIGARSAVFAPIPDGRLGLIVVDEEHDASYKQDQVPRYHGRDVAVRRGQLAAVPVVLGSATPALESWYNATSRPWYRLHRLTERAAGMRLPTVRLVDLAEERRHHGSRRLHLVGPTLEHAMGRTLAEGGQVLLLLNRRGYASWIACASPRCGWVMQCAWCDVSVVYHLDARLPAGGFVQCHHCLGEQRLPPACPDCQGRLSTLGFGTQRLEEELTGKFAQLVLGKTLLRLDSDTMRSAADYHDALERFGSGVVRVMVGTQMIAKGLDYPGVRLVGVINADTAINIPDFRATERTFQLVSQVAGRAGRSDRPGLVIVQTFQPRTPAIALAAAHDYESFAARELEERTRLNLPPLTRRARIVLRHEDRAEVEQRARALALALGPLGAGDVTVRGPSPCPIARIGGRHRWQVELIAASAGPLQRVLAAARSTALVRAGADMAIDVDPIAVL